MRPGDAVHPAAAARPADARTPHDAGTGAGRRRAIVACAAATVACGALIAGAASVAGPATAAAAAATCTTPAPKARGAGAAAPRVKRIVRRAGTNVARRPRIASTSGTPPRRLVVDDVVRCRGGAAAKVGDTLQVRYSLAVWGRRGTIETTWGQPGPIALALQRDALIDGWVEGLPGMHVGGRRVLVVPPRQGYGAAGAGKVPKNATLVFVVDLVGLTRP
ncbi:FKBP-type peptidyl-prolyl cis-trans isomerase [Patulibacter sp. SYSU D01012]|uniref:FKBP-type peptidyl-prolyl cis-trans isomerase n=1 Tax=Patulibacter sp. SYSU D01012 TaxID=2817381 RepID=UPI001B30E214|nr:FKBP-type peptidyl-prolyl cis-trans isomerase [Patulibacter sp. SYSU D01012]